MKEFDVKKKQVKKVAKVYNIIYLIKEYQEVVARLEIEIIVCRIGTISLFNNDHACMRFRKFDQAKRDGFD